MIDIDRQIRCVERELKMRRNVLERRVQQKQADDEIACMEAVLATLQAVKASRQPELELT